MPIPTSSWLRTSSRIQLRAGRAGDRHRHSREHGRDAVRGCKITKLLVWNVYEKGVSLKHGARQCYQATSQQPVDSHLVQLLRIVVAVSGCESHSEVIAEQRPSSCLRLTFAATSAQLATPPSAVVRRASLQPTQIHATHSLREQRSNVHLTRPLDRSILQFI